MTAGVPGTGIGGLFYLVSALILPLRGIVKRLRGVRVSWKTILFQAGLAAGIMFGIWATGWLIGLLVQPSFADLQIGSAAALARHRFSNIIRGAALLAGFATLGAVLGMTQILRWTVGRRRRPGPPRAPLVIVLILALLPPLAGQSKIADLLRKADAAFADEDRAAAAELYRQVLALDPSQSRAAYRLGVLAPDDASALAWFKRYVELEPNDAWGRLACGDRLLKLGKPVDAVKEMEAAARLAPQAGDIRQRLEKARLQAAPAFEPLGGGSWDSDQNAVTAFGAAGDAAVRGGWRVGGIFRRSTIDDGTTRAGLTEAAVRVAGRPAPSFSLTASAGLAWLAPFDGPARATPALDLRFRLRPASPRPSFELRLARSPLAYSPLLLANRAMRNEARIGLEIPAGPVRLRGMARLGIIETAAEESNRRTQFDLSAAIPVVSGLEISAQFHSLGFSRLSSAGYFAPRSVETLEAGLYATIEGAGPVSAEIDLGAGIQRLAKQNEPAGTWKPALRGWAWIALDLAAAVQLRVEAEAYSSPYAPLGVSTAPDWKYFAFTAGLLFRIR